MPLLTRKRVLNSGIKLPSNDKLLSLKGGTSLVYHSDKSDMVDVYTIEAAKAFYWYRTDFGSKPESVGSVTMEGYVRSNPSYYSTYSKRISCNYDLWLCTVPFVQVGSYRHPIKSTIDVDSNRVCKYVEHIRTSKIYSSTDKAWISQAWHELSEYPSPECVILGANYALEHLDYSKVYPCAPYDAFCFWKGIMYWLDPYHEIDLLDMIRSRSKPNYGNEY